MAADFIRWRQEGCTSLAKRFKRKDSKPLVLFRPRFRRASNPRKVQETALKVSYVEALEKVFMFK